MNRIIIFVLSIAVILAGCGLLYDSEDMWIETAGILSISDDRPAKVVIGAVGSHSNTCVDIDAKVYAEREGNTIRIWGKNRVPRGPGGCGDAVTETYGEVTVKGLKEGEYKVVTAGRELFKFRIEKDTSYVMTGPIINHIYVVKKEPVSTELAGLSEGSPDPVKVTIGVEGFFDSKCASDLKTNIGYDSNGDLTVDISGDIPVINSECALIVNPRQIWNNPKYYTEIELGIFYTDKRIRMFVNGKKFSLYI